MSTTIEPNLVFEKLIQESPLEIQEKIREFTYDKLKEVEKEVIAQRQSIYNHYHWIKENNERILKFYNPNYLLKGEELKFHSDWTWLMLVVEKIESITIQDSDNTPLSFTVEITNKGCRIYRSWTTVNDPHFGWHQTGNKLRSTYDAVIEFINWYNEKGNPNGR